jgi:MFS family permease
MAASASVAAPTRRSPYAVFRSRAFTLVWVGQFISTAGSALSSLAAAILVFRVTGSALSVGLMLIATALPSLLIGLIAGVLVDRYDRKRIMVAADLTRAVLVALVPALVLGIGGFRVPGGVVWLYALTILAGVATQFFDPAFASTLPELASEEDLAAANALMEISGFGSTAIGFAASGLIATRFPIEWAFYLDAVSFLVSAACVGLAALPRTRTEDATTVAVIWENLRAGTRFLADSPILRALFVVTVPAALAIGLTNALLLPFAVRALHATSFQYGLQEGLTSVGFVIGSLLLAGLADRVHEGQLMAVSYFGMAVTTAIYAGISSVPVAFLIVLVAGFLNPPSSVARALVVQRHTPREVRGRVFSAMFVVRDLLFVLGMAAVGLADLVNVRLLVLATAGLLLVSTLLALTLPGLRQSAAEWRRAARLLRAAGDAPGLGGGRVPTLADVDRLVGMVPALAGLTPRDRTALASEGRVYDVRAGTMVLRQGDASDAAYFILDGRLAVGRAGAAGQDDTPLAILSTGDVVGEIAALTAVPRTANVVADGPGTLLEVPAVTLRRLMRAPEVNRLLLSTMTARLAALEMIDLPRYAFAGPHALGDLRAPAPAASSPAASPPLAVDAVAPRSADAGDGADLTDGERDVADVQRDVAATDSARPGTIAADHVEASPPPPIQADIALAGEDAPGEGAPGGRPRAQSPAKGRRATDGGPRHVSARPRRRR